MMRIVLQNPNLSRPASLPPILQMLPLEKMTWGQIFNEFVLGSTHNLDVAQRTAMGAVRAYNRATHLAVTHPIDTLVGIGMETHNASAFIIRQVLEYSGFDTSHMSNLQSYQIDYLHSGGAFIADALMSEIALQGVALAGAGAATAVADTATAAYAAAAPAVKSAAVRLSRSMHGVFALPQRDADVLLASVAGSGRAASVARRPIYEIMVPKDPGVKEIVMAIEEAHPGSVKAIEMGVSKNNSDLYTDFDIVTDTHVIQVKTGSGKKIVKQLEKSQSLTDYEVIGFDANKIVYGSGGFRGSVIKNASGQGFKIINNIEELIQTLGESKDEIHTVNF